MSQTLSEVEVLQGLVSIPSLSTQEAEASAWLVETMLGLGYDRAYVDEAGSAVGEIGPADAAKCLVLLGHIDTVPGNIPVRIEGDLLYGRGSVDAKGPLSTFTCAAARVGSRWCKEKGAKIIVVGAVEEEAATSKGARAVAARLNAPDGCIIGEPSHWNRATLGYKGRILIELKGSQPMAHSAGPEQGVGVLGVRLWNIVESICEKFNEGKERAFDQLLPSLRRIETSTDDEIQDHVEQLIGIRLPLDFDREAFVKEIVEQLALATKSEVVNASESEARLSNDFFGINLRFYGYEKAYKGDKSNPLVRAFLGAVRQVSPGTQPAFVVKTGTADLNVVGPVWKCPIFAYGPGDSNLDHTPNEHISLSEYAQAIDVLEATIRNFLD